MASQTPPPASMTANSGRPSRLRVRLRRWRFALRRDPLRTVTSPAVVIHLADELLARTANARPDTIWSSVAVRPLAALLDSASRNRMGARDPFADRDPDYAICDDAQQRATAQPAARSCAQPFPGYVVWSHASETASPS